MAFENQSNEAVRRILAQRQTRVCHRSGCNRIVGRSRWWPFCSKHCAAVHGSEQAIAEIRRAGEGV